MIARLVVSSLLLTGLAGMAVAVKDAHEPCDVDVRDYCGDPYVPHLLQHIVSTSGGATLISTGGERRTGFAVTLVTDNRNRRLIRVYACTDCEISERNHDWAQHVRRIRKHEVEIPVELSYRIWLLVHETLKNADRRPLVTPYQSGNVTVLAEDWHALPMRTAPDEATELVVALMNDLKNEAMLVDAFQNATRLDLLNQKLLQAEEANPTIRGLKELVPENLILEKYP